MLLCEGEAEEVGQDASTFWFKREKKEERRVAIHDHVAALGCALEALRTAGMDEISAAGHRVVHGGPSLREHHVLTPATLETLRSAVEFAPLHLPPALAVIAALRKARPSLAQVICLDTAFHRGMPAVSRTLPLSADARKKGVERYGFHGLSLESILLQLNPVPARLVVAHLGNGSSITAVRDGRSIDTSMGLTPTGGIMMGTRSGDLDPGALLFLMRNGFDKAETLEKLVDHQSGLMGVSETGSDVRALLAARKEDPRADLALSMFCYQARKTIASMAAALEGLDLLVFTGGIGEHAASLRDEICAGLAFLGQQRVEVLPAQEDLQIARITKTLTQASA